MAAVLATLRHRDEWALPASTAGPPIDAGKLANGSPKTERTLAYKRLKSKPRWPDATATLDTKGRMLRLSAMARELAFIISTSSRPINIDLPTPVGPTMLITSVPGDLRM